MLAHVCIIYVNIHIYRVLLFVFRPTYMETSQLPVKGSNFLPMLGTHGH